MSFTSYFEHNCANQFFVIDCIELSGKGAVMPSLEIDIRYNEAKSPIGHELVICSVEERFLQLSAGSEKKQRSVGLL